MAWITFTETLRRGWVSAIYWGIGLAVWAVTMVLFFQDIETLEAYGAILDSMPPALLSAFGIEGAETFTTPEGILGYGYFFYAILILAVYAVLAGLGVSAGDEDSGILDMVLSQPLPRWRLMVEKTLAFGVLIGFIVLIATVALAVAMPISTLAAELSLSRVLAASVAMVIIGVMVLSVTVFLGALLRRRARAAAAAGTFVAASFMLDSVGAAIGGDIETLFSALSFFDAYSGTTILVHGVNWGAMLLIAGVSVALMAAALWRFDRRDLAV